MFCVQFSLRHGRLHTKFDFNFAFIPDSPLMDMVTIGCCLSPATLPLTEKIDVYVNSVRSYSLRRLLSAFLFMYPSSSRFINFVFNATLVAFVGKRKVPSRMRTGNTFPLLLFLSSSPPSRNSNYRSLF